MKKMVVQLCVLSMLSSFSHISFGAVEKVLVDNRVIHYGSSISSDGTYMLSTIADDGFKRRRLLLSNIVNGKIIDSKPLLVDGQPIYGSDASFSPDGTKILFKTRQNLGELRERTDGNIYVIQKKNGTWSKPEPLPNTVNSSKDEFYPIATQSGNIYFSRITEDQSYDIFVSRWDGSSYLEAEKLPENINTTLVESDAYVSPKEDYIIFVRMYEQGALGVSDLYISYKSNGSWGAAEHLGSEVNFEGVDGSPSISPDGKWMYFTSNRDAPNPEKFDTHLGIYRAPMSKLLRR